MFLLHVKRDTRCPASSSYKHPTSRALARRTLDRMHTYLLMQSSNTCCPPDTLSIPARARESIGMS